MNDEKTCEWNEDLDGVWFSNCAQSFYFDTSGPFENGFKFCPFCGLKMSIVRFKEVECDAS